MPRHRVLTPISLLMAACITMAGAAEQLPLPMISAKGSTMTPSFEGWYENHDGSFTMSFGYFNRNTEEIVEIPIGPNNFIEPGDPNQGQPTTFQPQRHWGVFGVHVPADFGYGRVTWTLRMRGETISIPGHLHRDWQIDALEGEANANNRPPVIRFGDREGQGPGGVTSDGMTTSVGEPLSVTIWGMDDGAPVSTGWRDGVPDLPINLTWSKFRGPGDVSFSEAEQLIDVGGDTATTMATFSEPGEYLLHVYAIDASGQSAEGDLAVSMSGYAQCCWTNGFVPVTVNP